MYDGKSTEKRFKKGKLFAFVWACLCIFGCYDCTSKPYWFGSGRSYAKEFRSEEFGGFVLWSKNRTDNTSETKRRTAQICKKELDISVPYTIDGFLDVQADSKDERLFFEYEFENSGKKDVCEFVVVFYVLDENGEPPLQGRNFVVLTVQEEVPAGGILSGRIDVSDWVCFESDKEYVTDFLFVSKIVYNDGSSWIDDTGLFV